MIRKNCEKAGLTRTIRIDEFRERPIAEIAERELANQAGNTAILEAMQRIRNGMEEPVAAKIIQLCSPKGGAFLRPAVPVGGSHRRQPIE